MATKLKRLRIDEIFLVDKGANPHAMITLFKRDVPEIETPQDSDRNFNATGRGPAHSRLLIAYDNYRRTMGPAQAHRAFEMAWADLSDSEKDEIRAEEAATEAAKEAAAAAAQAERKKEMNKMADDEVMMKAAHAISAGTIENTVRKSTWHTELRKMAAARQEDGETIERTVARLVKTDADALALFRASLSGAADDVPTAPVSSAPVLKQGTAYARLHDIGAGFMAADPKLTRAQAFAKAFAANPELAQRSKTESVFA
jgi:hypothetical protein